MPRDLRVDSRSPTVQLCVAQRRNSLSYFDYTPIWPSCDPYHVPVDPKNRGNEGEATVSRQVKK